MAIFSSTKEAVPTRKVTPRTSPWETNAEFQALKVAITSGKMKPQEQKGMYIDKAVMSKRLGITNPERAASDAMRKFIRRMGLSSDYRSEKYETNVPGVWVLVVTYDPPPVGMRVPPRQRVAEERA